MPADVPLCRLIMPFLSIDNNNLLNTYIPLHAFEKRCIENILPIINQFYCSTTLQIQSSITHFTSSNFFF